MSNVVHLRPPRRERENEGARGSWWARHRTDVWWVGLAGLIAAPVEWIVLRGWLA